MHLSANFTSLTEKQMLHNFQNVLGNLQMSLSCRNVTKSKQTSCIKQHKYYREKVKYNLFFLLIFIFFSYSTITLHFHFKYVTLSGRNVNHSLYPEALSDGCFCSKAQGIYRKCPPGGDSMNNIQK